MSSLRLTAAADEGYKDGGQWVELAEVDWTAVPVYV